MKFYVGEKEIEVKQVEKTIYINELKFDDVNDFVYFVNKLTDIAEELLENEI